jgi:peptidoglycan L-alanyl-D-glutamate endopeptidase CwlK
MADINELRPKTRQMCLLFVEACKKAGINVIITQTLRSIDLQNAYYSMGRESLAEVNKKLQAVGLPKITERDNKIVTKAKGGSSPHNYGLAWDFVPIINGVAQWNRNDLFDKCGAIAKTISVDGYELEYGGDFISIKDRPHIQLKNWKTFK